MRKYTGHCKHGDIPGFCEECKVEREERFMKLNGLCPHGTVPLFCHKCRNKKEKLMKLGDTVQETNRKYPRKGEVIDTTKPAQVRVSWFNGSWDDMSTNMLEVLTKFDALKPGDKVKKSSGIESVCVKVESKFFFLRRKDGHITHYSFKYAKEKGWTIKGQEPERIMITAENWMKYHGSEVEVWDDDKKDKQRFVFYSYIDGLDYPVVVKEPTGVNMFKFASVIKGGE